MQQIFRERLVARSRQLPRAHRARCAAAAREQAATRAAACCTSSSANRSTSSSTCEDSRSRRPQFRAAVRLLAGARSIHVLAQRRAFPVAGYLAYGLNQLEMPRILLDSRRRHAARARARRSGRRTCWSPPAFATTRRRSSRSRPRCHARGVPVIAITDSAVSPLKRDARGSPSRSATTPAVRSARWWRRCAPRRRWSSASGTTLTSERPGGAASRDAGIDTRGNGMNILVPDVRNA